MRLFHTRIFKLLCCSATLVLSFSCSKDADLLSDYVINDTSDLESIALLSDDTFYISNTQSSMLLDVLNNDSFSPDTQVTIVATTEPRNGSVSINEDNTLTYVPNSNITESNSTNEASNAPIEAEIPEDSETIEAPQGDETAEPVEDDSFEYTTEVTTEEGETFREAATVNITPASMGELKAFPGAEGFGKNTTGGRGGKVYHVTNLNDSGNGSLRYGVEVLNGARTIIFDISGYIDLVQPIKIRDGNGNITIAGQTAPEGGITLRGASIWILSGNVIIRHIKVRPGKNAYNPAGLPSSHPDYEPDDGIRIQAYPGTSFENIIIDHTTITWSHDGIIDISSANAPSYIRNVTIQNCLLGENIDKQYGVLVSNAYDVSFYRNILAFTSDRNIAISSPEGKGVEMVNNLVYCTDRTTWYREGNVNDFIGNKFISGKRERQYETFKMELSNLNADIGKSSIYLKDNTDDGSSADNNNNSRALPYIVSSRNYQTGLPLFEENEIENLLLNDAGSSLFYDETDVRVLMSIANRTGNLISDESSVGGYPQVNSTVRANNYDTDRDGMADEWEKLTYGGLDKSADGDENTNGFTNLEEFLHWLTIN